MLRTSLALAFRHFPVFIGLTGAALAPGVAFIGAVDYVYIRQVHGGFLAEGGPGAIRIGGLVESVLVTLTLAVVAGVACAAGLMATQRIVSGNRPTIGRIFADLRPKLPNVTVGMLAVGAVASLLLVIWPPLGAVSAAFLCFTPHVLTSGVTRPAQVVVRSARLVFRAPLETLLTLGVTSSLGILVLLMRVAIGEVAALTGGYAMVQVAAGVALLPVASWAVVALGLTYIEVEDRRVGG